jgi:hypothetical protein
MMTFARKKRRNNHHAYYGIGNQQKIIFLPFNIHLGWCIGRCFVHSGLFTQGHKKYWHKSISISYLHFATTTITNKWCCNPHCNPCIIKLQQVSILLMD